MVTAAAAVLPPVEPDERLAAVVLSHWTWAELLEAARNRYPRLARLVLPGGRELYLLTHPDTVLEVMQQGSRFAAKYFPPQLDDILGDSLSAISGPAHIQSRRVVQPLFGPAPVADAGETIWRTVREHVGSWPEGEPFDLSFRLSQVTLDVFGRVMCGADLADRAGELRDFLRDRSSASGARLPAAVDALIAAHRDHPRDGDLVDRLLAAQDVATGLSAAQVSDEVRGFVFAASEPPRVSLTWLWFLVGSRPAVLGRLREETAGGPASAPSPYARACYAESLRLYPASWRQERVLTADMSVDGRSVPAGSRVMAAQLLTHRDRRFWDRPLEFWPERWLDASGQFDPAAPGQPKGAWFPFGFGNRRCVGESLAWAQADAVIAETVATWDLRLVDASAVEPILRGSYRPRGGLPVVLRRLR